MCWCLSRPGRGTLSGTTQDTDTGGFYKLWGREMRSGQRSYPGSGAHHPQRGRGRWETPHHTLPAELGGRGKLTKGILICHEELSSS